MPAVSEHQVGAELVPVHPGSLSEQYNVCGTPDCHCKDPKHPRKHGPYYQLSYTWRGKDRSRFGRPELVAEMRRKGGNFKRFRQLINAWGDLAVELGRAERVTRKPHDGD